MTQGWQRRGNPVLAQCVIPPATNENFGRLGFSLIEDLKATGPVTVEQLDLLDLLVDYRNAIGHGDEVRIAALEASGRIKTTKKSYLQHRRSLDALAGTIDATVAAGLARVLGTTTPW